MPIELDSDKTAERKGFNIKLPVALERDVRRLVALYNASVNRNDVAKREMSRDRVIEIAIREYIARRVSDALDEVEDLRAARGERPQELAREALATRGEVREGALRGCAPERVRGHRDLAHRVALDAHLRALPRAAARPVALRRALVLPAPRDARAG